MRRVPTSRESVCDGAYVTRNINTIILYPRGGMSSLPPRASVHRLVSVDASSPDDTFDAEPPRLQPPRE